MRTLQKNTITQVLFFSCFLFFFCSFQLNATVAVENEIFNASNTEKKLAALNVNEKLNYLSQLLKTDYASDPNFDQWLVGYFKATKDLISEKNIDDAYAFIVQLYEAKLPQSKNIISNYVLSHPNLKKTKLQANAASILISHYNFRQNKDSIAFYLKVAYEGLKYDKNPISKMSYYYDLAGYYILCDDYFKALINYHKALDLVLINDVKNRINIQEELARLYLSLKYYEKAETYLKNSIDLRDQTTISTNTLLNYAIIKMRLNKLNESEELYLKIIEIANKEKIEGEKAQIYANYANLKRRQKQYDKALELIDASNAICQKMGISIGIIFNTLNKAEVYFDRGDLNKAITTLNTISDYGTNSEDKKFKLEYAKLRYKIYDLKKETHLANAYYRDFTELEKAVYGDNTKTILTEWELNQVLQKSAANSFENKIALGKEKNQKYFAMIIAVCLLFVFSFLFFSLKQKQFMAREKLLRENQRIAFDLELKSKELIAESIKNLTVENTKESIYNVIKELVDELPQNGQQKFKRVLQDLGSNKQKHVFNEFEHRFTNVYDEFYQKLKDISPEMTPTEVRICALMHLNLTTKEIALLTNRTTGTIDNTRSKIRKKLGLNDSDNLIQFLMSI